MWLDSVHLLKWRNWLRAAVRWCWFLVVACSFFFALFFASSFVYLCVFFVCLCVCVCLGFVQVHICSCFLLLFCAFLVAILLVAIVSGWVEVFTEERS